MQKDLLPSFKNTYLMKKYLILAFIVFLEGLFPSCKKDHDKVANDIYKSWEIIDIMSIESVFYEKNQENKLLITFTPDGTYQLKFDVNNCLGNYSLIDKENIEISVPGCTKICCDSPFSQKISNMLSEVNSYTLERNKLKLNVDNWGWINLILHN